MTKQLLEKIRHELTCISGLKAFDGKARVEYLKKDEILKEDLTDLDYSNLIKKIDRELEV